MQPTIPETKTDEVNSDPSRNGFEAVPTSTVTAVTAIIVALITLLILWWIHGPIVTEPNSYLFSDQGEAIRNYYVLSYHAELGEGLHEFRGMNHPFGEQIVYSEGQPSLSYPLKLLAGFSPWFHEHVVGVLNTFLIGGMAASAALLFLIIRRFGLSLVLSATSAVGLALLAPQCSRLPWMFPQAFSALVPVTILLVIRAVDSGWRWRCFVPLLAANLFFLFLNPYPGVIASSFTALTLAAALLLRAGHHPGWGKGLTLTLSCTALPILVFQTYLRLTDSHTGRPSEPAGFFDFTAEPASVFASFSSPFMPLIKRLTGLTRDAAWNHYEGNGYLGVFCILALVLAACLLVVRKITGRRVDLVSMSHRDDRLLTAMLIAALGLSVFAFGLPFRLMNDGDRWLALLGPVGQFRNPGRFIWPFFYVANIAAVVLAGRATAIPSTRRWRGVASIVVLLGSGLMIYEGVAQQRWIAARGRGTLNVLNHQIVHEAPPLSHLKTTIENVEQARYQAILTIPLFHIGSELLLPPSFFSSDFLRDAFALSKHLQLPLMSSMLGRISREESISTFQLYTPPFMAKDLCGRLQDKPLLVLVSRDRPLDQNEARLADVARPLLSTDRFEVRELEITQLCRLEQTDLIDELEARGPLTDFLPPYHYDSFDEHREHLAFRGEGALRVPARELGWVFDSAALARPLEVDQVYELSFWYDNRGNRLNADALIESNRLGGPSETHIVLDLKRTFYHQDGWSLFSQALTISHPEQRIRVGFRSRTQGEDLLIDELLVRTKDSTAVWAIEESDGRVESLLWNNHELHRR